MVMHEFYPAGFPVSCVLNDQVYCVTSFSLSLFAFRYVDPHKNPAPFFSSLFRNVRNNGVLCVLVPDTMHFARSPHVVRRCYGANCIKTEYLKELAVRIILAALAT